MHFGHVFNLKGLLELFTREYAGGFIADVFLHSDILAELDLPPSGISRLEDSMPLPSMIESSDPVTNDKDEMYLYYLSQIALRKLLNRAHTTLYKEG